jgi:predicted acyl esterase
LMERTPYGVDNNSSKSVNVSKPELAASGYIFVFGDIRGRYESEGQFVITVRLWRIRRRTMWTRRRTRGTRSTGC